jgi:hypothetical protein
MARAYTTAGDGLRAVVEDVALFVPRL